jgi:hypothetical protein
LWITCAQKSLCNHLFATAAHCDQRAAYLPRKRQAGEWEIFIPVKVLGENCKKTAPPTMQPGGAVDAVLLWLGRAAFFHRTTGFG